MVCEAESQARDNAAATLIAKTVAAATAKAAAIGAELEMLAAVDAYGVADGAYQACLIDAGQTPPEVIEDPPGQVPKKSGPS